MITESGEIVPDLLDVLRVMTFRAHRHFKDGRREPSIDRQRPSQGHVLRTTIARMPRHLDYMKAEARVPFERTRQRERECLNFRIAEARVQHERLHVGGKAKGAVHVRFDVVIKAVPLIR